MSISRKYIRYLYEKKKKKVSSINRLMRNECDLNQILYPCQCIFLLYFHLFEVYIYCINGNKTFLCLCFVCVGHSLPARHAAPPAPPPPRRRPNCAVQASALLYEKVINLSYKFIIILCTVGNFNQVLVKCLCIKLP